MKPSQLCGANISKSCQTSIISFSGTPTHSRPEQPQWPPGSTSGEEHVKHASRPIRTLFTRQTHSRMHRNWYENLDWIHATIMFPCLIDDEATRTVSSTSQKHRQAYFLRKRRDNEPPFRPRPRASNRLLTTSHGHLSPGLWNVTRFFLTGCRKPILNSSVKSLAFTRKSNPRRSTVVTDTVSGAVLPRKCLQTVWSSSCLCRKLTQRKFLQTKYRAGENKL